MLRWKFILSVCCILMTTLSWAAPADSPQLVILVSIDQMRADYLERFAKEYTGGLRRLTREGLVYSNATLNYAASETGPGHASLVTGSYPHTHGILGNDWPDRLSHRSIYCVADSTAQEVEGEGGKVSPKNLRVSAFGDWLKAASPQAKVISISAKDRAAILMGGQHPDYVFWYNGESGHMMTSDYYVKTLPEWVKQFNAEDWVGVHVPAAWTKLKEESVYAKYGPDDMPGELVWGETTTFPHVFQADIKRNQILTSPWGDLLLLDFARAALRAEKLGQRQQTDFLALGLSCTDYVGHAFGPDSHEMHDQLLRLDRALGEFLQFVDQVVGKGKYVVALSADHAVLPLPEYLAQYQHQQARRILFDRELKPRLDSLSAQLQRELGAAVPLIRQNAFLDYAAAVQQGVDSLALESRVRAGWSQIAEIADVYFRRELVNSHTPSRPFLDLFQRSYYAPRGEDFQVRFCEYCLVTSRPTGTAHGSPYRYDTHVPLVFWGNQIRAGRVEREVHTVDVAPTLAKLLNIAYPATVEGTPLAELQ